MFQIRSLTSLRFFAAAAVVFSHTWNTTGVPFDWMRHVPLIQGVSFFFVLSGFILSVTYHRSDLSRHRRSFYIARFARVYPLYAMALILVFLIRIFLMRPISLQLGTLISGVVIELVAVQSWFTSPPYVVNGVGYSVSTEMFFYAVFPFIKTSQRHFSTLLALSIAAILALLFFGASLGFHASAAGDEWSYLHVFLENPLTRLPEFIWGLWLGTRFATREPSAPASWDSALIWSLFEVGALLACLALSRACFAIWVSPTSDELFRGAWKAYLLASGAAPAFGLLIWLFAHERGLLSRFLRWTPLTVLGAVSYSLYLVHEVIFELLLQRGSLPTFGTVPAIQSALITIGLFAVMLAIAYAGYAFVETPARAWIRGLQIQSLPRPVPAPTVPPVIG